MRNNKDDEIKHQYEIQRYEQRDLPLSTHIEYLKEYLSDKAEEDVHLRDYLNVILKRKKLILLFLASVFVATILLTFMMTPQYKATTVIKIMGENPNVLTFKDVQGLTPGADYYQTQYEILKSRSLAERVITKLKLDKNDEFMPVKSKIDKIKGAIFDNTIGLILDLYRIITPPKNPVNKKTVNYNNPLDSNSSITEEIPERVVNALISRLEITPVKNSQLVNVSFISDNPEISTNVANTVAQTFIEFDLESRVDTSKEARNFLQKQVEIMKEKLGESEQKLNAYASSKEIIIDKDKESESIQTQKLADISSALNSVTAERMQKEALYREVKESQGVNPAILSNSLIQGLKSQLSSLEAEYSNLSKIYTPDYPKMKSLKSQIDSIQERIKLETSKIMESLESDYKASLKKEENLTKALNAQQRKVLSSQSTITQFEVLKREVDSNKALYNNLLQRLNEVGVSANSTATNIQILDKATYPRFPFKPNIIFNILLSIFFGLAGGIGLAFLVEYFDNSVKDTTDIEKGASLPTLGMIPDFEDVERKVGLPSPGTILLQKESDSSKIPMIIYPEKATPVAETFRSISAFILLSSSEKPPKTILVTGPGEKVGKTTICVNISRALVESLGNGIIIDADLRRPKLHQALQINNSTGLSTFLSGNIDFDGTDGTLIKPTSIKGLSVITSGPIPPNPSELIGSTRMQALIYALESAFGFVIFDSPPVMGLPDAIYLSKLVSGTVLVVKAGETTKNELIEIKKLFRGINAKILGVVLNGVKKNDLRYGSYNYYYSSYYSSYFKDQEH
jgi:capsular exopolysaccharide synthesis family protein